MKKLIPFTFSFLYFAGLASFAPFVVLYYQKLGFSGLQISLLTGVAPLITLVFSPLWTNMADATHRHKLILTIGLLSVIALLTAAPFFKGFAILFAIILLFNIFGAPINSLADSATLSMLAGEKEMYGRVRLGGTLGWGLAAPVAGLIIQKFGPAMTFWWYAAFLGLALIAGQAFQFGQPQPGAQPKGDARVLLTDPRWIRFLGLAFLGGTTFASTAIYYSSYMQELGAPEAWVGIALFVSTLSEIPVFFFGDYLLKRFKPYGLLVFAVIMTGARSLLFAAANTPLLGLLAQLLQGLTFPAMWIAGVSYADEHAPGNLKATAQGLFGAMTFGLGSAFGGFIGGLLLESLGGRGLFGVYGALVLVGVALITLIKKATRR